MSSFPTKKSYLMKNLFIYFLAALVVFTSASPVSKKEFKITTIVLDAGHGGKDPGCSGKNVHEGKITLDVVLELGKMLNKEIPDLKVIYTRKEHKFVELHDRAKIANDNKADLFISIHCNSGQPETYGSESYVMGLHTTEGNLAVAKRENEVVLKEKNYKAKYNGYDPKSPTGHILMTLFQHAYMENSIKFAQKVEENFKNDLKRKSRGVKQAGFLVLWKTSMPSTLVEIGYLSNSQDEAYLSSEEGKKQVAKAITDAVKAYKKEIESEN